MEKTLVRPPRTTAREMSHVEPPRPSEEALGDSWRKVEERRGTTRKDLLGLARVTAFHHTDVYGNEALRQEVKEKTLGRVDRELMVFFVNRTRVVPGFENLLGSVSRRQLTPAVRTLARNKLEEELRKRGIRELRINGSHDVRGESGRKVELQRLEATYELVDTVVEVDAGKTVEFEGGDVDVNGWLGAWIRSGEVMVVGGIYPADDLERRKHVELTEAVDVQIDIDLDIWPRPYRHEIFELTESVLR